MMTHASFTTSVTSFHLFSSSKTLSNVCGRPSIATKSRRSSVISPTLCLAAEKKDKQEEEVLDEKAMRAAEIHEVLIGLQDFKERIVNDATQLAKKVRAPKKQLEAALSKHPDILKINGHIAELQEELKQLGDR